MKSTNPEAVILGALFDFAGHLRTSDIINPLSGIDGFAKKRKLEAQEIPTLTWRDQLDSLRDNAEHLPSDSDLVRDLLTLAEVFNDVEPGADNHVFELLNNAAAHLRRIDTRPATGVDVTDGERYRFGRYLMRNQEVLERISEQGLAELEVLEETTVTDEAEHDPVMTRLMAIMTEEGLWPLKEGAQ
jgi:hypothetical protein